MVVCLSPNGRNLHADQGPPTRLVVGTVDGVAILERAAPDAPWQPAGRALAGQHVSSLLYEPCRGGLFAGIHGSGLYASADEGATWTRKTRGIDHDHIWMLACRERAGGVELYAGAQPAHLYRSADYGESWEEVTSVLAVPGQERWMFPPPPHLAHVKTIAFDPTDERTIYLGIEQGALLKSTDGGASWRELDSYYQPTDLFYKDVHRLLIAPNNPRLIYMGTGDGLYVSTDAGETWEHRCPPTGIVGYPDGLVLDPDDDQVLYMAGGSAAPPQWRKTGSADACVARSRDGGRTWERLEHGLPGLLRANIEALSIAIRPGGFSLFAGTTDGDVFASDNGGESWARIAHGIGQVSQSSHYRDLPLLDDGGTVESAVAAR
jgi:photosystem II stability/assembly factor-like uncharacterized protein